MLVIAVPAITPLFAFTARAEVPACCRRGGKHHCMMLEAQQAAIAEGRQPILTQASERCPFQSKACPATRNSQTIAGDNSTSIANLIIQPTLPPQERRLQQISFQDSHQRRGPPAELPLSSPLIPA